MRRKGTRREGIRREGTRGKGIRGKGIRAREQVKKERLEATVNEGLSKPDAAIEGEAAWEGRFRARPTRHTCIESSRKIKIRIRQHWEERKGLNREEE
jgi:hypothetical protein